MSADLVWGWATIGFVLMVPGTLLLGRDDRRFLAAVKDAEILAKEWERGRLRRHRGISYKISYEK